MTKSALEPELSKVKLRIFFLIQQVYESTQSSLMTFNLILRQALCRLQFLQFLFAIAHEGKVPRIVMILVLVIALITCEEVAVLALECTHLVDYVLAYLAL